MFGSFGDSRTEMPPSVIEFRTWNRVSGTVASSTSSTLTPERLSPPMIERLSARAMRLVSRLVVTTAPFFSDVPYAIASRVATSGVMSTFASPAHAAAAEQRARAAALPDDRRRDDRAGLDGLERVHLDARVHDRAFADEALVAEHRAFLDRGVGAQVAGRGR